MTDAEENILLVTVGYLLDHCTGTDIAKEMLINRSILQAVPCDFYTRVSERRVGCGTSQWGIYAISKAAPLLLNATGRQNLGGR